MCSRSRSATPPVCVIAVSFDSLALSLSLSTSTSAPLGFLCLPVYSNKVSNKEYFKLVINDPLSGVFGKY